MASREPEHSARSLKAHNIIQADARDITITLERITGAGAESEDNRFNACPFFVGLLGYTSGLTGGVRWRT